MPSIVDQHPEYGANRQRWDKCRDFTSGKDALLRHDIKCQGEVLKAYIPKISRSQKDDQYHAYLDRALFYGATGRTLKGLVGLVFAKEPVISLPGGAKVIQDDADGYGTPLSEFSEKVVTEVLGVGRCGVLVDRPDAGDFPTKLDEEKAGYRPAMAIYPAESIINWAAKKSASGVMDLSKVVLAELSEAGKPQYRELLIEGGLYQVNIWIMDGDTPKLEKTITPTLNGSPLTKLPFYFFGPSSGKWNVEEPPLLDLIEVNRSHYMSSADLEHGRYYCGLPTPVFAGFGYEDDTNTKEIVLGSSEGISGPADAKASYLEFTGSGLSTLEKALEQKERMMAMLGSRMLAEDKRQAETAEALRIRASGESATLASIANTVSRLLTQAVKMAADWMNVSGDVSIQLNTEYTPTGLSAQELTALLQMVQSGKLPKFDFFAALKQGGIIGQNRTFEDYQAETPEDGTGVSGF